MMTIDTDAIPAASKTIEAKSADAIMDLLPEEINLATAALAITSPGSENSSKDPTEDVLEKPKASMYDHCCYAGAGDNFESTSNSKCSVISGDLTTNAQYWNGICNGCSTIQKERLERMTPSILTAPDEGMNADRCTDCSSIVDQDCMTASNLAVESKADMHSSTTNCNPAEAEHVGSTEVTQHTFDYMAPSVDHDMRSVTHVTVVPLGNENIPVTCEDEIKHIDISTAFSCDPTLTSVTVGMDDNLAQAEGKNSPTVMGSKDVKEDVGEVGTLTQVVDGISYVVYESERQMSDIMRLITRDLSEPYSIYTYRYFIHNWPQLCFLAMDGDRCIGAIVSKLDIHKKVIRRGYIAMLAVDQAYRKRGIGSQLVVRVIRAMIATGCDEVVLETDIPNTGALHLYENLGFVRDKRLFRYYLNGVDALRLKLWLR